MDLTLVLHGTRPTNLTPRAVLQSAAADLRKKTRNNRLIAERKKRKIYLARTDDLNKLEKYAFRPEDVEAAKNIAELIQFALDSREWVKLKIYNYEEALKLKEKNPKTKLPTKPNADMVLIYTSEGLLEGALELAN